MASNMPTEHKDKTYALIHLTFCGCVKSDINIKISLPINSIYSK